MIDASEEASFLYSHGYVMLQAGVVCLYIILRQF